MSEPLDNPPSVAWSHSDRQVDFYELPNDGREMHEALGWLLRHYKQVRLWMGVETEDGAELYLTCAPSHPQKVVARLRVYADDSDLFGPPVRKLGA